MTKSLIVVAFFLVLLQINSFYIPAQEVNPQRREFVYADLETYEKVLDIAFPKDTLNGFFGYGFVLRFKPSFDAESQINIENNGGKIQAVEYKVIGGNIYEQLGQLLSQGEKDDPEELAKQIRIQKRILNISPIKVQQWRTSFYQNLGLVSNYERKKIGENMKLSIAADDGTAYLLWCHGASDIYYEFGGGPYENSPLNSNDSALVNWMKSIKAKTNKIK